MVLDRVLEKEIKKFNIDPEVKLNIHKYMTKDERWEIVSEFLNNKAEGARVLSDKKNSMFSLNFKSVNEAKKFSDNPSEGLAAFARKKLSEKGEDPRVYDVFFNLGITYDPNDEKKNKMVVIRVN